MTVKVLIHEGFIYRIAHIIVGHMYKLRQWRQVLKLYFPKYIDKVVIIEIKQTCHTVRLHYEDISNISFYFYQRGTGPKYGSGVPCLSLKKSLVLDKLIL
jgi:hypothetical protein